MNEIKFWTKKSKRSIMYCSHFLKDPYLMELLGVTNESEIEDQINDVDLSLIIDTLGSYEDLMKEYKVDTFEQLETLLKRGLGIE